MVFYIKMDSLEMLVNKVRERPNLWYKKHPLYKSRKKLRSSWLEISNEMNTPVGELKRKWKSMVDYFRSELKKNPSLRYENLADGVATYKGKWEHFNQMTFLIGSFESRKPKINVDGECSGIGSVATLLIPEVKIERLDDEEEGDISNFSDENSLVDAEDAAKEGLVMLDPTSDDTPQVVVTSNRDSSPLVPPSPISEINTYSAISGPPTKKFKPLCYEKEKPRTKPTEIDSSVQTSGSNKEDDAKDEDLHFFKSLLPYMRKIGGVDKLKVRNEMTSIVIKALAFEGDTL